jgi:uncharacterized protein YndB with AHSA1/START domain
MTIIAQHESTTSAPAELVFARVADSERHPDWSHDLEWVRLDEPLREGARGVLKPKGGPKSRFVVSSFVPGSVFADTTFLPGARVTFHHEVHRAGEGSRLLVRVTLVGPLAWLWKRTAFRDAQTKVEEDARHLLDLLASETA